MSSINTPTAVEHELKHGTVEGQHHRSSFLSNQCPDHHPFSRLFTFRTPIPPNEVVDTLFVLLFYDIVVSEVVNTLLSKQ